MILPLLSGCATSRNMISPMMKIVDLPPKNQIATAELGDTLVQKGKLFTYQALELSNDVSAGDGFIMYKLTVPAGLLIQRQEDDDWKYYYSGQFKKYSVLEGALPSVGGLKISKKNFRDIFIFMEGVPMNTLRPNPQPVYIFKDEKAVDQPSFEQQLIYNGKIGNQVKFLYRELTNDMMRGPFSQEIQYDLNESKIVGFKGCRIEILEATNTQLKYRVLESFPDTL